jgi:hypothetical protein
MKKFKFVLFFCILATLFASCNHLKSQIHAAKHIRGYELYELSTYECGECRKKRLMLELEGSLKVNEIKKEVKLGSNF